MKTFRLLSFCLFVGIVSYGQFIPSEITFSYDASGNRVLRQEITLDPNTKMADTNELKGSLGAISLLVFPNPTTGLVTIKFKNIVKHTKFNLQVYSQRGALVLKEEVAFESDDTYELDFASYLMGTYYIDIYSEGHSSNYTVIKID